MTTETAVAVPAEEFVPAVSKTRLPSIAAPTNWSDLMQFCGDLAKSSLVPKDFRDKPADLAIAISMGNECGLHWAQAIQSIAVINGRPSLWGDGALAVCMAHPDWEWLDENESTDAKGVSIIKRRGYPAQRYEFTLEMARSAGLLGKDTYKAHQRAMLQRRARARCMSATFADALKGIAFAEDVHIERVVTGTDEPVTVPKAKEVQAKLAARKGAATTSAPVTPSAVIDGSTGEILDADAIIKKIDAAKSKEELTTAIDLARSIKDAGKQAEASAAYKLSLGRLRSSEAA